MKIKITVADKGEEKLFYACDEEEIKAAKIGNVIKLRKSQIITGIKNSCDYFL